MPTTKLAIPKYDTDLTDGQWALIGGFFPRPSKRGRPRVYDYRQIVNAILYLLKSGCQWRMPPNDFLPWYTVYLLFYRWRLAGLWDKIHDKLRTLVRKRADKKPTPTVGIVDSQSVNTTHLGGSQRGYDAGKKETGRKRHLIVDTLGMLLAVIVHSAGEQDHDGPPLVFWAAGEVQTAETDLCRLRLPTEEAAGILEGDFRLCVEDRVTDDG